MKRPVIAAGVLAAVVVLNACNSVESTANAATVADADVTVESLESMLTAVSQSEDIGIPANTATGTIDAAFSREALTVLIGAAASEQFLTAHGESVTEDDRAAVVDGVDPSDPFLALPDDVLGPLVDVQAASAARARIELSTGDELAKQYAESPASLGVMCVRHVLVETEAEADAIAAEAAAGASLEDLATERSIDPTAADNGGALRADDGSECMPTSVARASLDSTFVEAALRAVPGEVGPPVQTPFGWHVIEARPFDEVGESLGALYEQAGGELLYSAFVDGLDIHVDPRYGRWDPATSSVVAL